MITIDYYAQIFLQYVLRYSGLKGGLYVTFVFEAASILWHMAVGSAVWFHCGGETRGDDSSIVDSFHSTANTVVYPHESAVYAHQTVYCT